MPKSGAYPGFLRAGVTLCQSEGTQQIVMSFSPLIVGCRFAGLLKRALQKRRSREPKDPRRYAPKNV